MGVGRANPFAAASARGNKSAMRPFCQISLDTCLLLSSRINTAAKLDLQSIELYLRHDDSPIYADRRITEAKPFFEGADQAGTWQTGSVGGPGRVRQELQVIPMA